jgi:glycosyltransferase involved in cell wall biosynthesis
MVSILILTLNEEANIADCLDSVAWADDVLVLDSGSEDRTVEIAEAKGARVMRLVLILINSAQRRLVSLHVAPS